MDIQAFYESQVNFYEREVNYDTIMIENCTREMAWNKDYYGFETVEYKAAKKRRAYYYRRRKKDQAALEDYKRRA